MGLTLRCRRYIFLAGGLHLELVHCLTGLGDIDLVGILAAHFGSLLFSILRESQTLSLGNRLFLSASIALPLWKSLFQSFF